MSKKSSKKTSKAINISASDEKQTPSLQDKATILFSLFGKRAYAEVCEGAVMLLEEYPEWGIGWKLLGVCLGELGKTEQASAAFKRAAELLRDDPETLGNLGAALRESGRDDEAVAAFKRTAELFSSNTRAGSGF